LLIHRGDIAVDDQSFSIVSDVIFLHVFVMASAPYGSCGCKNVSEMIYFEWGAM